MATRQIIGIDDHRFYRLFTLSSKFAPSVLHKVIDEFCAVNHRTFQNFLDHHKHDIFHIRSGGRPPCCSCNRPFIKVLSDAQWDVLFKDDTSSLPASHPHYRHDGRKCSEVFTVPLAIRPEVCDVTLASALILNIHDLLLFILDRLCNYIGSDGVEVLLNRHQHELFHQMEKRRCCQCSRDPEGKDQLKVNEWKSLYGLSLPCCASPVCSCQYRPKPQLSLQTLSQQLLRKLGQVVCPVITIRGVRNSLAHTSSGTMDETGFSTKWSSLESALDDMMHVISDSSWTSNMTRDIADLKVCPISRTMWDEYHKDIHQWLNKLKEVQENVDKIQSSQEELQDVTNTLQEQQRTDAARMGSIESRQEEIHTLSTRLQEQQQEDAGHIEALQDATTNLQEQQAAASGRIENLQSRQDELERRTTALESTTPVLQVSQVEHTDDILEKRSDSLSKVLLEINHEETECVLLAPLQQSSAKSIDKIYAPVLIRKDFEETLKEHLAEDKQPALEPVEIPEDIFLKNGRPTRFVVMQGEAGRGKSIYCLKLMKYWCNAKKNDEREEPLTGWEKSLGEFHYLFEVKMRDVPKTASSVADMICYNLKFKADYTDRETIYHVLRSDKYRCLIIMDGLDEWKNNEEIISNLTHSCIPNLEDISNSTFFFTMRPWKFESMRRLISSRDRVLEIKGLNKKGLKTVIEKVLVNHFNVAKSSTQYEAHLKEIKKKAHDKKLKSLLQVPLLAVVSVMLWFEKKRVGKCMTTFYMALIRMLIERAIQNETIDEKIHKKMKKMRKDDLIIPNIIQKDQILNDFIDVLLTLGQISFDDLTSKETNLVFPKRELEEKLGESELEFALKVGLLSQSEARGDEHARHVSISFFHKSVQEFLAAMHISSKIEVSEIFLEHLSTTCIKVIMDFENVNLFVSGLSPSLSKILSQKIVEVTNNDPDICRYRETFHHGIRRKVKLLYKMQLSCLRELQQSGECTSNTTQQGFHISDVYIDDDSDIETVRMTADILRHHSTNIVSLFIIRVPNDKQHGIDDAEINDFLQQTTTLRSLFIYDKNKRTLHTINTVSSLKSLLLYNVSITPSLLHDIQTSLLNNTHIHSLGLLCIKCVAFGELRHRSVLDVTPTLTTSFCGMLQNLPSCKNLSQLDISYMLLKEKREMLVNVLPHLSHLKVIKYSGSTGYHGVDDGEYDYFIVHMVSQWTQLQHLGLGHISLCDRPLELPADMAHIEEVWLYKVKMSTEGWGKFITSLINIQHQYYVVLLDTDVSADCVTMIRSSPHFTVTRHDVGKPRLEFTSKFPPTPQT